jgi:hypothetical protein
MLVAEPKKYKQNTSALSLIQVKDTNFKNILNVYIPGAQSPFYL